MRLASSMSRWFASRAHRSAMNRRLRAMEAMPALEAFEPRLMLSSSPGPEAGQGGPLPVDDHGNDYANSTFVALPSMTAGLLEEASDEDWFTFRAYSHFTYTVDVSLGDLADSTVELVESETGNHLAYNDDFGGGLASHLEFTPEFGGDISAIVRSYGHSYTGTYTFSITETAPPDDHGNEALAASPMFVNSQNPGTLENFADQDWFQFELVAGTTYRIQTVLDGRHYDLYDSVIYLYGSDGVTELGANDDDPNGGTDSRLDFTATVSGTHFLQVIGYANSYIGSYLLAIEELPDDHGDLPGLATPMALGVQATGQFEVENDVDVFSFQGEPGAIYELTGFADNFPELDVYMYNAAGDPLADLYFDSAPYSYFVQAPSDGLIVFDLQGYFYEEFNPAHMYALTIAETEIVDDHANEPFNGTEFFPLPGSIPGDIQAVNDVDYFYFYAVAEQAYTFRTILDTLGDSTLTLYDQDGVTELAFNDDYFDLESQIDWIAPIDGYYFLAVRGYDEEELGTYDLVIETGDSQPVDVVGAYMEVIDPETFVPGSLVDLRFDLYNYGPGAAAEFYVTIYISRDGFIDPFEDLPLSDFFVSESVFSGSYSNPQYITVQLPDAFSGFWDDAGQYTLGLLIDPYGNLNENNTGNNSNTGYGYDSIAIGVGQIPADLTPHTIQSLDAGPFQPGDVFQATSIVLNYSPNSSPATTIDYYLSQDGAVGDVGDVWIGSAPLAALGPYGSYEVTAILTLPPGIDPIWIGDGQYHIGTVLDPDDLVPELDELNNANVGPGADSFPIQVQTPDTLPDLIGQSMAENTPVPLNPGQQTTLNLSVLNDGGAPAGASHFYIYLSANPQRTLYEGELLGVFDLAAFPAATTAHTQVTVSMPEVGSYIYGPGAGTYYLHVVWDSYNAVSESIETNNHSRGLNIDSTPVTVQLPDLVGYNLSIDGPASAGGLLDLSYTVSNLGIAPSAAFHTSIVLSANDTIGDFDDRYLDTVAFAGLAPSIGEGRSTQVLLPAAADPFWGGMTGFFYIGLVVDSYNQNYEAIEGNNYNQAIGTDVAPIQINELILPDLTTTAMTLLDSDGAGGEVGLELTLENVGAGDSLNHYNAIYLSQDAVLDSSDYSLYVEYMPPLGAGQSYTRQIFTYLPNATDPFWSGNGTYHLLSVSDDYGLNVESSEANNFGQGLGVDVVQIQVSNVEPSDLVASQLVIDTLPPYLPGGTVFYEFTMENLGAAPSGEFSVWVYISQDATIDFNDRYLAEFVMGSLDPLQSTSNSISFQLPSVVDSIWSGAGEYYIGLMVDAYDFVLETDNANNLNQGLGVDIAAINVTFLRGDFDADGDVDLSDITLYQSYTRGGNPWSSIYELAGNPATLDQSDLDELIRVILGTQYGDADLNQQVSLGDLVLLAGNFNGPGGWGEGDFTGDGMVTLGDLVLLAENYGFDAMAPLTGVSLVALEGQDQADEDDAPAGLDLADILDEIAAGLRD